MRKLLTRSAIAAAAVGAAVALVAPVARATAPATVVVAGTDLATSPTDVLADPAKWFFYNDQNDTIDDSLGTFVLGPGTPPHGAGSAEISVTGAQRRNLATYQFSGTKLADITELRFTTYNPSAGNGGSGQRSAYLNFNVDFDSSDGWQNRLVFVPAQNATVAPNGAVVQDSWQEWDAIAGGNAQWTYSGQSWPGNGGPGTTPKSWSQILADYPGIRIRVTDSWLGLRVGEPYPDGYTEDIDSFTFGTATGTTVFDFEPDHVARFKDQCKADGWKDRFRADGSPFKNQGDCIQYVNTGR